MQYNFLSNSVKKSPIETAKGNIISKGLFGVLEFSQKTNEFVFTTTTNSFVLLLGEFEDTKKSFQNYLTFSKFFGSNFSYLSGRYSLKDSNTFLTITHVRPIVSVGLDSRIVIGIKVPQPLPGIKSKPLGDFFQS